VALHTWEAPNAPSTIRLGKHDFALVESLVPVRDAPGTISEFRPQDRYEKADVVPLHTHGHGPFCKFRISAQKGLSGVYALVVAGSFCYIGECKDLRERFGSRGYGTISPRNCYIKGQPTNCKINRQVFKVAQAGGRVDLYFYPTPERKAVEEQLIADYSPLWNS
jgi:hypothetical protein